jgi:hypothetical protein
MSSATTPSSPPDKLVLSKKLGSDRIGILMVPASFRCGSAASSPTAA